jgi:hypothetical protein
MWGWATGLTTVPTLCQVESSSESPSPARWSTVATLGILALRAAVQRRRSIGVLRALGYRRRQILAGLLTENIVLAGLGTAMGLSAGLFTGALVLAGGLP